MAGAPRQVSDSDILKVFTESHDPVLWTAEVAARSGFGSTNGARKRLETLLEDGYVDRKKKSNFQVWWITESGRQYLAGEPNPNE